MTQVCQLAPDAARGVLNLSRALVAAVRNWMLYPPDHPTVAASVARLHDAIHQSSLGPVLSLGITPDTLLVAGAPADRTQTAIAEAAALLHDRDLLQITFVGDVPSGAIHALLRVLTLDAAERRERGGPATIWRAQGEASIVLEQIDYERVLTREDGEAPEPARRDDVWRSIVMAIGGAQKPLFDERAQQRLLAIAGSARDIGDLATAVMAPHRALDGSPMITSQAAIVLAAFHHLTAIVTVMAPERLPEVMGHIASATTTLDPHVAVALMQSEDDSASGAAVVRAVAAAFDDTKIAQLLATALALDGQATDRLATMFTTIAPDEERRRRVLKLTRTYLGETDFGHKTEFEALWSSMEKLLVSYDEKPFVSETYRASLDGVGGRAERMAVIDLPPELGGWLDTLGQENVRRLSVLLLIDLLNLETDAACAGALACDLEALAGDLLLAGAYEDARAVTQALARRAASADAAGRDACRQALDRIGESLAMRETAALLGEVDEPAWDAVRAVIRIVGPSTIEALKANLLVEDDTPACTRAETAIVGFGAAAVARLGSLVADDRWFVQRRGARLFGRIGSAEAVPFLQPLLRRGDARVARDAVAALAGIDDPAAARAIQTVLRASTGALRRAVVDALVADRDPRIVPMLVRIIDESQVLGADHEVVLEAMAALGEVGDDEGVPAIATTIRRRGLFARRKLRALKRTGVQALARIDSDRATLAIHDAARNGDRMLRKIVRAHYGPAHR